MEGIVVWIVIIVGWVIIKSIFSSAFGGGGGLSNTDRQELYDKLKLQLKVSEEVPPKERGLPDQKCLAVKVKGLFGHPTENNTKIFLTIHDNTDLGDDEFGPPVLSAHASFAEKNNRVFSLTTVWETSADTYFPDWYNLIYIPKELILAPYKGRRKLKFNFTACDTDAEVHHSAHDDLEKIKYSASTTHNFTSKDIGYLEEFKNRDKVEDLTINLAMNMAASDGHLDQKELNVIKDWAKSLTLELDEEKASEKKKHFAKLIKETYKTAQSKKVSISKLVSEFNDKASKSQKYLAIELMLSVASSDSKLAKEEEQFVNKIAKSIGIDLKTFKDMKNKVIANVDKIDFAEKPSEASFGITDDMDDAEKRKILRKEYTKWNGQTNHRDPKKKKRAKEMVKIIADLRKQYSH